MGIQMNGRFSLAKIGRYLSISIVVIVSACTSNSDVTNGTPEIATIEPTLTTVPVATSEPQPTADLVQELPCTISLWHSFDQEEIGSLLDVSSAYEEFQPDVEFDFMFSPHFDLKEKYKEAAQAGGGPAILIGSADWGPELFNDALVGNLANLTDSELLDQINSAALSSVQNSKALMGLPLNVKGVLLFRNANIIPEGPRSAGELMEYVQAATQGEIIGAYLDYGLYFSGGHLEARGGSLMDGEGNPSFNDADGISWMEMLKAFKEAFPVEQNSDNGTNLFREGRVGMVIDDISSTEGLAEAIGEQSLKIDPWPDDMSGYIQSDVIYLNANLSEHDLDCGYAFMEHLLSAEAQELFSNPAKAGFIPAIDEIELSDPLQAQAALAFQSGTPLPVLPEMTVYWEPINIALQSVVEFDADPGEALTLAEQSIVNRLVQLRQE